MKIVGSLSTCRKSHDLVSLVTSAEIPKFQLT